MKGTSNTYLYKLGKKVAPGAFVSVYACDELEKIDIRYLESPSILIVNVISSTHSSLHGHWVTVAIYKIRSKNCAYYMDSLGYGPTFDSNIWAFLKNNFLKINANDHPIQHPKSEFCGFYAIAHCICVENNINMDDFYSLFSAKPTFENDDIVIKFICKHIKINKIE